jgi:hypothetical protein
MAVEDQPEFPRFNSLSSEFKNAEDRLLAAIRGRDNAQIAHAKLLMMAALDEYKKAVGDIPEDHEQLDQPALTGRDL